LLSVAGFSATTILIICPWLAWRWPLVDAASSRDCAN
jgi:hypothetical protein